MTTHPHGKSDHQHVYSKDQARTIFRKAILEGGTPVFSSHVWDRMKEYDLDIQDLEQLAQVGRVLNEPENDINTGNMKYRMERTNPTVKAVFVILGPNRIKLITVWAD